MVAKKKAAKKKATKTNQKRAPRVTSNKPPSIAALARQVLQSMATARRSTKGNRKKPRRRNPPQVITGPPKKIEELLGSFLGHGVQNLEILEAPVWAPADGVLGGQVVALEYFAFKPHLDPEGPQIYRHEFQPGNCQMVFTADGVIILLGNYTIGPEGLDD